ncbi:hypothetical protein A7982_12350 [Minicystis rosea]|nr:hypothetical protein A7982_12350 [Minicystis rosea]
MSARAALLLSTLALGACARASAAPPSAAPAEEPALAIVAPTSTAAAPAPAPTSTAATAAPAPAQGYREIAGEPPRDLAMRIEKTKDGQRWDVTLERPGQLVTLRDGDRIVTAYREAELEVDRAHAHTLAWEATNPDALLIVRGVLRIDTDGKARIGLAEAPTLRLEEARHRHACSSYDDAFGGITLLCRVTAPAEAKNLFGNEGVTSYVGEGFNVGAGFMTFRLDLPAHAGSSNAFALSYDDRGVGVLVHAEASRAQGEDRTTLAVLSAERLQPMPPMAPPRRRNPFLKKH